MRFYTIIRNKYNPAIEGPISRTGNEYVNNFNEVCNHIHYATCKNQKQQDSGTIQKRVVSNKEEQ